MRATDAAWLAGFFDGDGNLNVERRGGGRGWRSRVRISNCNREAVERVRELVGLGTIFARPLPSGRMIYQYGVEHRGARTMLYAIAPYVVAKRERVLLALEAEELRSRTAWVSGGPGSGRGGHRLPEEAHERLAVIAQRIKDLNEKGPSGRARLANGLAAATDGC
jgi:hypothetical protein